MARPGLRNVVVFSVFVTIVALLLRSLRSASLPPSSTPTGGSAPSTTLAPAGDGGAAGVGERAAEPPVPVVDALPGRDGTDPLIAEGEPEVVASSGDLPDWVDATGDEPGPATHPVKAKLSSGIYHLPGGLSYDRTQPDRWYRSAEAAEADGLRAAKR